jgi:hypothetical protein
MDTAGVDNRRPAPISWLFWVANAVAVAWSWCFRRGQVEKKTLSRAEEKQRRKALVREALKRN